MDDAALVRLAREGDKQAFAVLLARHRRMLLALCRRALGDPGLAEDAAQEAALEALLGLDRLRQPERFGSWLAGIGLNVCRRWRREQARESWSLAAVMGQELAEGPSPLLATALRVLPSGWAPVAVAAADRSDWPLAIGALAGLAVLAAVLLLAWATLLPSNMRRRGGQAHRTARRGAAPHGTAAEHPAAWQRLLPAGPTGAVVGRELRAWRRDPGRTLLLLLALLISGLNLAVPAVAFHAGGALPWVGVAAALIVSTGAANVYGDDGTALWLTRMVPGVERADVRGRQAAWLLVVAPVMVALTVALTALSGQGWAWPWVLATLPAVLGGTAGLLVFIGIPTGVLAGLIVFAVRRWLPAGQPWRGLAFSAILLALLGGTVIDPDNVDFRILEPTGLAIALFGLLFLAAGFWLPLVADRWGPGVPRFLYRTDVTIAGGFVIAVVTAIGLVRIGQDIAELV